MGVEGMVGGGIFSVLALAIGLAGQAAPLAFALGGIIALLTGFSYARLGAAFQSDGGSFTYLEHAFEPKNIAGTGGWLLLVGYIGTMALYAYTFGVYGTAMFGEVAHSQALQHLLQSLVLLIFLGINLYGVRSSGESEVVLVMIKGNSHFCYYYHAHLHHGGSGRRREPASGRDCSSPGICPDVACRSETSPF